MNRNAASALGIGILAAGALLMAGCTATAVADDGPRSPNDFLFDPPEQSARQVELLEGGVTREEYVAGFRTYSECMTSKGFELIDVDLEAQVIPYGIPQEAVQTGVHQECYAVEFAAVDKEWQLSHLTEE